MIKRLYKIQQTLKAPKSQYNSFGKYNYRSCEDILEAVKPLLEEDEAVFLSDEVVNIGNKNYVKATAIFFKENNNKLKVTALAREAEVKKGMDDAQITGSASSYARKYALNGLFAIDDTKDADTMDNNAQKDTQAPYKQETQKKVSKPIITTNELQNALYKMLENGTITNSTKDEEIIKYLEMRYIVPQDKKDKIQDELNTQFLILNAK